MRPILLNLPVPVRSPRLLLRPPQAGDGLAVNQAIRDSYPELKPWMPFVRNGLPSVEDSEESCRKAAALFLLREDLRMLVMDRGDGSLIGSTGLHRINWEHGIFEIGYWIRSSRAGEGFATEAAHALTRYAFETLSAKRVEIHCNAENQPSRRIPVKLGFAEEAVLKNHDVFASPEIQCRDHVIYARTSLEGIPKLEVTWAL